MSTPETLIIELAATGYGIVETADGWFVVDLWGFLHRDALPSAAAAAVWLSGFIEPEKLS